MLLATFSDLLCVTQTTLFWNPVVQPGCRLHGQRDCGMPDSTVDELYIMKPWLGGGSLTRFGKATMQHSCENRAVCSIPGGSMMGIWRRMHFPTAALQVRAAEPVQMTIGGR